MSLIPVALKFTYFHTVPPKHYFYKPFEDNIFIFYDSTLFKISFIPLRDLFLGHWFRFQNQRFLWAILCLLELKFKHFLRVSAEIASKTFFTSTLFFSFADCIFSKRPRLIAPEIQWACRNNTGFWELRNIPCFCPGSWRGSFTPKRKLPVKENSRWERESQDLDSAPLFVVWSWR